MAFAPIRTDRLIIRTPEPGDVDSTFERRNLAEVAHYQDWEMPYTRERAERSVARSIEVASAWPDDHRTWNPTVVDAEHPDRILGDLAVELRWDGRVGYFGYTFHPDQCRQVGAATIEAEWREGPGSPARFFRACGFEPQPVASAEPVRGVLRLR